MGWERHGRKKKKTSKTRAGEQFIIDTREPESMHHIFDTFKLSYTVKTLKYGDYKLAYANGERKTIFDFVASFRSTRLFDQLEGLTNDVCFPFLFVTGTMGMLKEDVHFKHINEKTVIGAMGSCMCRYAVNIIWVPDDSQMVMVMSQLYKGLELYTPKEYDNNFMLLTGTVGQLSKMGESRRDVISTIAEVIGAEGVNVMWAHHPVVGLQVISRMFHKVNEGKRGKPRKRLVKKDTGNRTADLVRNYLRVEPALAISLTNAAKKRKVGVMRYIMETPNSDLLAHPGVGNVTLKRLRELVG